MTLVGDENITNRVNHDILRIIEAGGRRESTVTVAVVVSVHSRECADDPVGVDFSDDMVVAVGNEEIAHRVKRQANRPAQLRGH